MKINHAILFTNIYNFCNRGEILQLEALTKHLRGSELSVLSIYSFIDQRVCENLGVKVVGTLKPRHSLHLGIWALYTALRALLWRLTHLNIFLGKELKEILHSDVIVDQGGDTFSDDSGIIYTVAHSYSLLLAWILGKPYIICSQTVGPFKNPITRLLSKLLLRGALAIIAREPLTYKYLTQELRLENVYLAPDLAFLSKTTSPSERPNDGFTVGLNVSPLISNWMFPNAEGLREKQRLFIKLMSEVVAEIWERYGCQVLLIPHVTGPTIGKRVRDDRVVMKMVFEELKEKRETRLILSEDLSVIKDAISRCDIFIGSRMHSVISAINAEVPTIPLAYSLKTLGLAEMLDLSDYVVDVRDKDDIEELKSEILSRVEEILNNYDQVAEVFSKASKKAGNGAMLNLKVIENAKLLSLFRKRKCRGCGTCTIACPHNAINMVLTRSGVYRPRIDFERCTGCEVCIKACPMS